MKKNKLLIIKLGGSVITDKKRPFTAKREVIDRLAGEIKRSLKNLKADLIIIHGSGSFGHVMASKYQTQKGIINKKSLIGFSKVADSAVAINRIVVDRFLKIGLKAVSFAPLSMILTEGEKLKRFYVEPLKRALEIGLTPVLFGDVVLDLKKRGFCIYSGEKIIAAILKNTKDEYKNLQIIYCTDTDGVYDGEGKTIKKIDRKMLKTIKQDINHSKFRDVTGGMIHKVNESLLMAEKYNADVYIINGLKKGNLERAISGEKLGTQIGY